VLGPTHPDTLFCACNLAVTLRSLDQAKPAQDLMQQSIAELERVMGANHPHLDYARRWRRINRDLEPQPV
jgi:Tetratricopeptide repeat